MITVCFKFFAIQIFLKVFATFFTKWLNMVEVAVEMQQLTKFWYLEEKNLDQGVLRTAHEHLLYLSCTNTLYSLHCNTSIVTERDKRISTEREMQAAAFCYSTRPQSYKRRVSKTSLFTFLLPLRLTLGLRVRLQAFLLNRKK